MNLLACVLSWDESSVVAEATSHREPAHPLRRGGVLPVAAGIEYGAQAAAAHGVLLGVAGSGFLASVRTVRFFTERLDDVTAPLRVRAEQLGGGAAGVLYRFDVSAEGRPLVEGRVTVAFAP
jgi:predicted hotdog family 3-hydroxylacyl-ACP dehydratase